MAMIQRSVRVDDCVFDYIDRLNALRLASGLTKLTTGEVLEDAVRYYVAEQMLSLKAQALDLIQNLDNLTEAVQSPKVGE